MIGRSFFEEQDVRRRQTWFFLALGAVWMGLMGFMVVVGCVEFVDNVRDMFLPRRAFRPVDPRDAVGFGGWGAAVAVGLWAIVAFVLHLSSGRVIPKLVGAHSADKLDKRLLAEAAEEVGVASGTPTTAIRWYVLESPAQNAFACGRSPRHGSIVVTRGLLNSLEEEELRAVLAHELAHLKNGDTVYMVQALGFVWVFIALALPVIAGAVIIGAVAWLGFEMLSSIFEWLWGGVRLRRLICFLLC